MEWISVEDRLPDDCYLMEKADEYLICCSGYVTSAMYLDGVFTRFGDWQNNDYENVTHWQPLPKPPKK